MLSLRAQPFVQCTKPAGVARCAPNLVNSRRVILLRVRAGQQDPPSTHDDDDDPDSNTGQDRDLLERMYASKDNNHEKKPGLLALLQKKIVDKGYVEMKDGETMRDTTSFFREWMRKSYLKDEDPDADPFHAIAENAKDLTSRVAALLQLGLTSTPALVLPLMVILVTIITYAVFGSEFVRIGAN